MKLQNTKEAGFMDRGVVTAGCDCDCSRRWRNWVSGADGGAWDAHTFSTSPHKTPLQHQTSHSGRWLGVRGQWLRPLLSRPGCVAAPGRIRRTRMRPPFQPILSWIPRGLNSIRFDDSVREIDRKRWLVEDARPIDRWWGWRLVSYRDVVFFFFFKLKGWRKMDDEMVMVLLLLWVTLKIVKVF